MVSDIFSFFYPLLGSDIVHGSLSHAGRHVPLYIPALRPASQADPMRSPRGGTSVVWRDTVRLVLLLDDLSLFS